jgi:hypothetical protein
MIQENKELLLKDLSARLPYKVKASYYGAEEEREIWDEIEGITLDGYVDIGQYSLPIESVKPYLFPFSSMTEEQEIEYDATFATIIYEDGRKDSAMTYKSFDWLNKNNFDYRGLIDKGLALDATGLNIY